MRFFSATFDALALLLLLVAAALSSRRGVSAFPRNASPLPFRAAGTFGTSGMPCRPLGAESSSSSSQAPPPPPPRGPEILAPFPEAANPRYMCEGPVGTGAFVIRREGGPTSKELSNENILKIVLSECSDLEVNTLVWKCLGYRFENGEWNGSECFPKWREKYPSPPDLIGMQRVYERGIDAVSLRSNQALVRSVPAKHKQSLKEHLRPLGFKGYSPYELTPNKTRRAQCANWLLYYREHLFGVSVEELLQRREDEERRRRELEENANFGRSGDGEEWKPPVREVF